MFDKDSSKSSAFFVIAIISLLYGAGEMLQLALVGPNWVRWYLSDFGFPFSFAVSAMVFLKLKPAYAIMAGGLVAVSWELFQFSQGEGDPIDVLVFVIAVSIGLIIVRFLGRRNYEGQ